MSYYDYEDYYREPSEFEQQIDELKDSLFNAVKKEHKDKMGKLEKENIELQEVKKNWNVLEKDYKDKLQDLQRKIETAERDAKRMRLKDFMSELKQQLWQANSSGVYAPKCDKCDDKRQIYFNSPTNKRMSEDCECGKAFSKYKPVAYELYSFQQNNNDIGKWYKKPYNDSDYYSEDSKHVDLLVKTEDDFKSIGDRLYSVFFVTEELCQKYCDIKNKENGITNIMTKDFQPICKAKSK